MNNIPIFHDPEQEPGTSGPGPEGSIVRFVSADEYYTQMLGFRMNVTLVFLNVNMADRVDPENAGEVDDTIARVYWEKYQGLLVPPRIRHLLNAAAEGPSGSHWMSQMESIKDNMIDAPTMDVATELHAVARVEMLLDGADHRLSDFQVSAGELMADYLLLQRATMEDIRTAEERRENGQTRAAVLEIMDRSAELSFERAVATVHKPQVIAEAIPLTKRSDIERFARNRETFSPNGLFAKIESGRFGF